MQTHRSVAKLIKHCRRSWPRWRLVFDLHARQVSVDSRPASLVPLLRERTNHDIRLRLTRAVKPQLEDPHFLYWAKAELQLLAEHFEVNGDSSSLFEIQAGLQFIQTEWATTHLALQSLLPSSRTFDYLWTVFPPDCLIVGKDPLAGTSIWRTRSAQQQQTQNGVIFSISAEYVDWDGKRLGIVRQKLTIDAFTGTLAIADLPYVPLRYHPHRSSVTQRVLERAQKKLGYCELGFQIKEHEGLGIMTKGAMHYSSGVEAAKIGSAQFTGSLLTD